MLPKITDYWDTRVQSIPRFAQALEMLPTLKRDDEERAIREAIDKHVIALKDDVLTKAASAIVDDLYKAANDDLSFNSAVSRYLAASSSEFFRILTARGYVVQYVIDTAFRI